MESTLPPPPSASRSPGGDLLRSLSRDSFARVLRLLGCGIWRAETNPFVLQNWAWGEPTAGRGPTGLFPGSADGNPPEWEEMIYPPDRPMFQQALEAFLRDERLDGSIDYRIVVHGGDLLWIRQWLLERETGATAGRPLVTALVRVVDEEKRLQWEVMRTCESERARLGQEIHDDVCQVLAGIHCLTHLLQQRLAGSRPEEAAELERINLEIQGGLERTRALAHGLLPSQSDFNTLQQALRDLGRQVAFRFNLQLNLQLLSAPPAYSRETLLHLYRIVQEASSNAFKHGRATRVDVTFERRDRWHMLSIQDNGTGLPADTARAEGVGLNVIKNRAELLGGRLLFGNGPEQGVLVQVYLPVSSDL